MIALIILCAVVVFIVTRLVGRGNRKQSIKVGQPPALPVLGHALQLSPDKFLDTVEAFHSKFGGVVEVYALSQRIYLISNLDLVKEILLKRPKIFRRIRTFDYGAKILGFTSGLFNVHGVAPWNRMRKLTSPSLAKHNVVGNVRNALKWSVLFKDRLLEAARSNHGTVDIKKHAFSYTLGVLIDAMFGSAKLNGEMQEYFFKTQFAEDIYSNFIFIIESTTFPFPKWLWHLIPHYHNIEKLAVEADGRLDRYSRQIINERRAVIATNPHTKIRTNMIDILLQNQEVEGEDVMTDDEIVANVKTFFAAGSETTSITVSWIVYYLTQHPEIQKDLQDEAARLFIKLQAQQQGDALYDLFSAESLPLTHAVVKETIRLVSPAPTIFLQLESDTEPYTLSNGLVLQPEDHVFTSLDSVHWNSDTFAQTKNFLPRRWLTSDRELLAKLEESFLGFGGGPRMCPGWAFAIMESVVATATLVHHLDMQLACEASEVKRVFAFTAQPDKVPVTLRERQVQPLPSVYME